MSLPFFVLGPKNVAKTYIWTGEVRNRGFWSKLIDGEILPTKENLEKAAVCVYVMLNK